jgi:hypothetical protein
MLVLETRLAMSPYGFGAAKSLEAKIQIYPGNDSDHPVAPSPTASFDFEDPLNALDGQRTSKGMPWQDVEAPDVLRLQLLCHAREDKGLKRGSDHRTSPGPGI